MDDNMKVAFVLSQITCAQITLASMQTANQHRADIGATQAYTEKDFERITKRFLIAHNDVLTYFTKG